VANDCPILSVTVKRENSICLFFLPGCKKDQTENKPEQKNTAPVAVAGQDTTIYFPSAYAILNGDSSYDPDGGKPATYHWSMVSGPTPGMIHSADISTTSVAYLIYPGVYEFQLTVKDSQGSLTSDKVKVTVVNPECTSSTNDLILQDQVWVTDEWNMTYIYLDLYSIIPPNSNFKQVFIKSDASTEWEPVGIWDIYSEDPYRFYTYSFGFGTLYVYPSEKTTMNETPDIKIVYCNSEGTE
jgi:hypothetical protein